LLLALASTVILGFESRGAHEQVIREEKRQFKLPTKGKELLLFLFDDEELCD
jgi:hypothetical protein